MSEREIINRQLHHLVGLELSGAHLAADMLMLQFGPLVSRISRNGGQKWLGSWSLHIQCPWQIFRGDDLYATQLDPDTSKDVMLAAIQRIRTQLGCSGYPGPTFTPVSVTEAYATAIPGGACIVLSKDFRILIVPSGGHDEDWRLFSTQTDAKHFVVEGGVIDPDSLS